MSDRAASAIVEVHSEGDWLQAHRAKVRSRSRRPLLTDGGFFVSPLRGMRDEVRSLVKERAASEPRKP